MHRLSNHFDLLIHRSHVDYIEGISQLYFTIILLLSPCVERNWLFSHWHSEVRIQRYSWHLTISRLTIRDLALNLVLPWLVQACKPVSKGAARLSLQCLWWRLRSCWRSVMRSLYACYFGHMKGLIGWLLYAVKLQYIHQVGIHESPSTLASEKKLQAWICTFYLTSLSGAVVLGWEPGYAPESLWDCSGKILPCSRYVPGCSGSKKRRGLGSKTERGSSYSSSRLPLCTLIPVYHDQRP